MPTMLTKLISQIDAHLAWRREVGLKMAESTLGRLAANDGKLVSRLRSGRQITFKTRDQITAWIAADRKACLASLKRAPSEDRSAA